MSTPRVGDAVWKPGHSQPNGKIVYIDYEGDREVHIRFHDTNESIVIEWDEFHSHLFNQRLNQWIFT